VGLRLLLDEISRSHSHKPHSIGLLWLSEDLYLAIHNTHEKAVPAAGFEPVSKRPQTHALDRDYR